jgi:rhamnulokinase
MRNTFLAFDLGTTSGRAVLGELNDGILSLQEIHRFTNEPILAEDQRCWNIELLFQEIKKSLVVVADQNLPVESIGITTWGVDFSIMGDDGIPSRPIISQGRQNDGNTVGFAQRISEDKIYGQTGVPVSHVTSLFQLANLKKAEGEPLRKTKHLLFIPDIFNFLLVGILQTEFSIATTSQLYNPVKRMWDHEIFKALGIPVNIMSRLVEPGSIIGSVSNNVSYETGIARIPVVAVASNAAVSAIAAIPAFGNNWVYICTGSICQVGFESARPIINKKSQHLNFTNQGGAGPVFNIQKNLTGLWLLEECMKAWEENNYSISDLMLLASDSKPFTAFIDTDHVSLMNEECLQQYKITSNQPIRMRHNRMEKLQGLFLKD